jgi:uncharacterized integral membrane protein
MADQTDHGEVERRSRARQIGVLALTGLAVVFAVVNLDDVSVNWIVGTWHTPLIIVIAVSVVVGAGAGYLVGRRRERV